MSNKWTVLVVTCRSKSYARAVKNELKLKQKSGFLPRDLLLLCVDDPVDDIGSGGATLNALLIATEHLSLKHGFTIVTSDVLRHSRVLIVHLGRYFPYDPCRRAFTTLPLVPETSELGALFTNFDALFFTVTEQLAANSPPGLWVCSSDMILSISGRVALDWDRLNVGDGVLSIAVPSELEYARSHGVYKINRDHTVANLIYKGTRDEIEQCSDGGAVPLVTGVVFFSTSAAERMLASHVTPPLSACTYMGVDSGMEALGLSLFFDILLTMASEVEKVDFVRGQRCGTFGKSDQSVTETMVRARSILWKHLRGISLKAVVLDGEHQYFDVSDSPAKFCSILKRNNYRVPGFRTSDRAHCFVDNGAIVGDNVVLINSFIGQGCKVGDNSTLIHCYITNDVIIGDDCYVYGLDEENCSEIGGKKIPDGCSLIGMASDDITMKRLFVSMRDGDENFDKNLRSHFVGDCGSLPSCYENVLANQKPSYFTACLFPTGGRPSVTDAVMLLGDRLSAADHSYWSKSERESFCDRLERADVEREFRYRSDVFLGVAGKKIADALFRNVPVNLLPFFRAFVAAGNHCRVLGLLDDVAVAAVDGIEDKLRRRPDVSARAFACIADVLGFMANEEAGLRSGPSANREWTHALESLERGDLKTGVAALARLREKWMGNPDDIIRASRHYEGAEQILIRHAVMSVSFFIRQSRYLEFDPSCWYCAECPARIDLAGGWTDTPPVCYEFGGSVVNAAVLLNGKKPIGARIRKISEPTLVLKLLGESEIDTQTIVCSELKHLRDYHNPQSPGALLKACFVFAEIVDLKSEVTLKDQLLARFGGGFELQTYARVPQGSGLGTSSILAGAVMVVVLRAGEKVVDFDSLIHSVLLVEQMLTTGGGWQDQVGGLIGGIKIARSGVGLPLRVTTEALVVSDAFFSEFSSHLKLIYTGKTRLARNLLQNVLRNWYTKRPEILNNCAELKGNAEACAEAFKREDLAAVGDHIGRYWQQKKLMATGCEPDLCARMMERLRPHAHGLSLGGAGGGGFVYMLAKEEMSNEELRRLLDDVEGAEVAVVYDVTVDRVGMLLKKVPIS